MKLTNSIYYLLLAIVIALPNMAVFGQDTFLDDFSPANYTGNDGTQAWNGGWIENDFGGTDPLNGRIRINGNRLRFRNFDSSINLFIRRDLDLLPYTGAVLTFDYDRSNGDESVGAFFLNTATGFYEFAVGTPTTGSRTGSITFNIPSTYINENSSLLFFSNSGNWGDNETVFIDNVLITTTGLAPLVSVNNVTVNENAGTATFTATLTGTNVPGGFSVDYTTLDDTAYADSDYITTTGTLNFSGFIGESQTITVPIINNTFGENTETFFVNLDNASSPSVRTRNGVGTILDDGDAAIGNDVPLSLFDDFSGYYDYALTAGTLRTADEGVDPCAITTTSSNTLTTPILTGSTIEKAYLIWGHSGQAADDVVTFQGQSITADVVNTAFGDYYGMVSDVTSIIDNISDPSSATYTFTDLVVDNGPTYCGSVVFGGWSLYIFYTNPILPAVSINMYNGFDGQGGGATVETSSYTLDGFFAIGSSGSKTSVLSWEGDPGRTGNEIISLTTTSGTTNLTGDGDNSSTLANVFNSTIYDNTASPVLNDSSLFGFDLDTYDISSLITQGETSATTNIQTADDFVILNSVLLKVPSNLITGTVFEDINYPGGVGRDFITSSGVGIEGVTVELYDNTGVFIDSDVTDVNGDYSIGGMANGTYNLRVVNNTVRSTRGGGTACTTCIPVQTFRSNFTASTIGAVTNEVGGTNPADEDVGAGTLTGAQTVSTITINSEGAVDIDFGFNFNTIVNTNASGQGSLGQFIINSNNLDESGLNIEANSIFDPATGEDTSIFMIPTTGDPLGRTTDVNFISGFFDIDITGTALDIIIDDTTHIDGRTQTSYSGDTNSGTVGSGGTVVGTSAFTLPNFNLPEIQIQQNGGNVIQVQANNIIIRNVALFANNNAGILIGSGSATISENLIGVNADGLTTGQNINDGILITNGTMEVSSNFISRNVRTGVRIEGGTSSLIENNHITDNGTITNCDDNIRFVGGSGVVIRQNLIERAASVGIDSEEGTAGAIITENTVRFNGINSACQRIGIRIRGSNFRATNNVVNNNERVGIVVGRNTATNNLISQNSIFANNELGIDLSPNAGDGVTINDLNDSDTGPNGYVNFPIFESVTVSGTTLKIVGWSRPGAIIEVFLTDINQGTATPGDNQITGPLGLVTQDYGEGQFYLGSGIEGSSTDLDNTTSLYTVTDGNTDNTNRFNISITLGSGIPPGSIITATATVSNSTSEFGNGFVVGVGTIITNRKITYRVKPN